MSHTKRLLSWFSENMWEVWMLFFKIIHFNCRITFWVYWSFTYHWISLADEIVSQKLVCKVKGYYRTESRIGTRYLLAEAEDTTTATGKIRDFWESDCRSDWRCDMVFSIREVSMFGKNMLPSYSSPWICRQKFSSKVCYLFTKLHGVTSPKTTFIFCILTRDI